MNRVQILYPVEEVERDVPYRARADDYASQVRLCEYETKWSGDLELEGESAAAKLESLWLLVERGGESCPVPRLSAVGVWERASHSERISWLNRAGVAPGIARHGWVILERDVRVALIEAMSVKPIRSFVVGDLVRLDGVLYVCATCGWNEVRAGGVLVGA